MSKDVQCPYCNEWQEINHDDGYGYDEDRTFEQECSNCDMCFAYTASISFYYEAHQAPCMNGKPHEMETFYSTAYPDAVRCKHCDHEVRGKVKLPEDRK